MSPAPVIAVAAAACVRLTTFGHGDRRGAGRDDEVHRATGWRRDVPPPGFWLITDAAGTVALAAVVTVPTTSPAPVIAVVGVRLRQVDDVRHHDRRWAGRDDEIDRAAQRDLCSGNRSLADHRSDRHGRARRGRHDAHRETGARDRRSSRPPASGSRRSARSAVQTKRRDSTALPLDTLVLPAGFWLITKPAATVSLDAVVIVPTLRPATPAIARRRRRLRLADDVRHGDARRQHDVDAGPRRHLGERRRSLADHAPDRDADMWRGCDAAQRQPGIRERRCRRRLREVGDIRDGGERDHQDQPHCPPAQTLPAGGF